MIEVLYSILAFLLVISIIVITHEFGHYISAKLMGVKVVDFAIGWGPKLFSIKDRSGTNWKVCAVPIGGYIKYFGDDDMTSLGTGKKKFSKAEKKIAFVTQSLPRKAIMAAAGPLCNFLVAILIFTYFFSVHGKLISDTVVTMVEPNSVASKEDIKVGDKIRTIDGSNVSDFSEIERFVKANPGIALSFGIEREGKVIKKVITPKSEELIIDDEKIQVGKLGIGSDNIKREAYSVPKAFLVSVMETANITSFTLKTLGQILTGHRGTKELASVIRISKYSGKFVKQGASAFMWFIAMLSINLGLVNLFPIPPLDGGHIFLYCVEGIASKKVYKQVETYSLKIGVAILVALMVFAIVNDIIYFK